MTTVLWILPLLAIVAAERGVAPYEFLEQRSFEFATEKPMYIDAKIQDFVLTAMKNNFALQMTHNCTAPLPIWFQKCRRTFLYSTSESSYRAFIFQDNWLPYLLKVTQLKCQENADDDQSITILAEANEKTHCRVIFSFTQKTTSYTQMNNEQPAFLIFNSQIHQTLKKVQLDLDALIKNKKVDVVTSIDMPFDMFLAKCNSVAPYRIRTGRNLTDNEDQVDLIIRMAQLLCPEDRSSSFDIIIPLEAGTHGDIQFEVVEKVSKTTISPILQFFLIAFVAIIILLVTCLLAASLCTCLICNRLADDNEDENLEHANKDVRPIFVSTVSKKPLSKRQFDQEVTIKEPQFKRQFDERVTVKGPKSKRLDFSI